MSIETVEINGVNVAFDKEKTKEYLTDFNKPCDCQGCRNYYANISSNKDLVCFLNSFGIDITRSEEIFYYDLGNQKDSPIQYEAYYGVFGEFKGEQFSFEKFGVEIKFSKSNETNINTDREDSYFWVIVETDYPYILDEERDLPIAFSQKIQKLSIVSKIKSIFIKK